jgi:hypothetical protein
VFDVVWLKPENEMPNKSSTLPMPVVVVFPSVASSLTSKGFPLSLISLVSFVLGFFVVCVATVATGLLFGILLTGRRFGCGVDGRATSVGLFRVDN